jgi:ankyrin repeat protein
MTTRTVAPKGTITELHRAVVLGDLEAVRKCLRAGHAIDPRDAEGHTPFLLACKHSEPEAFDILRLAGAEIDAANARGMSGLFLAAATGVVSLARVLIKSGADVNRPAARGLTPLIAAVMSENPYMVRRLIAAGANVRHTDATGCSVVKWARKVATAEMVELIRNPDRAADVDGGRRDSVDLHQAARTGDVALIRECLSHGVPVEAMSSDGSTPLMVAARQNRRAAIQALLEAGADPYRANRSGFNSLLLAANNVVALRPFVFASVDLNHPAGRQRTTPLIHAARQGFGDVVQYLLEAGVDPHRVDAQGLSAHDHAAANGQKRIAQMLREAAGQASLARHESRFRATLPA